MGKQLKISHLADIHFTNDLKNYQYEQQMIENTYQSLLNDKPDLIVLSGDIIDSFNKPTNEAKQLAGIFLNKLASVSPLYLIMGNHDYNAKSKDRKNSLETIIKLINNQNITYFDKTGFFEDEKFDITWAIFEHSSKTSPYAEYPNYEFDNNRLVINLFHDPINSAKTYFGQEFNQAHYISLSDFKKGIGLLGDIHQRQIWKNDNNQPFVAYPSSLRQLSFGESPDKHGYLNWIINDNNVKIEEINIDSDYVYLNLYLNDDNIDYDDLSKYLDKQMIIKNDIFVKVKWTALSSEINKENERKISKYLKEKYKEIKLIKFDKVKLKNTKIQKDDVDYIESSLKNIDNTQVQQDVFKKFLLDKGYDLSFVEEVLSLDNIINKRLNITTKQDSYTWEVISFSMENYRSHGDKVNIDWSNQNGIFQINGQNGAGKTNLMSALCYLFFNKTLETLKKQANGDNRFINNKRNLDYCEVSAIVKINEHIYKLTRRTERKWDRTKTKITGTPTTFKYEMLDETYKVIENLTDEEKGKTQKILENTLGSFDEYLRSTLITADTLNNLLSLDEAVFMDNILRDSGLDIFEKKLEEYKNYKKETYKKEEKIVLDVLEEEKNIETIKTEIENIDLSIVNIDNDLQDIEKSIEKGVLIKENEIKKLKEVNQNLLKITEQNIIDDTNKLLSEREIKVDEQFVLEKEINSIIVNYDKEYHDKLLADKEIIKESIDNFKNQLLEFRTKYDSNVNNKSLVNGEIYNLNKEIKVIEQSIEQEKVNIKTKISYLEKDINNIFLNIDNEISRIKQEIELDEKGKTCSKCNRLLDKDSLEVINQKIKEKLKQIETIDSNRENRDDVVTIKTKIKDLENQLVNTDTNDVIKKYNNKINEINTNIISKQDIMKQYDIDNEKLKNEGVTIANDKKNKEIELTQIEEKITKVNLDKVEFDKKVRLEQQKENIPVQIQLIDLKIENQRKLHQEYIENTKVVEYNEKIQLNIIKYDERLKELNSQRDTTINQLNDLKNQKLIKNNTIENINVRINKFKKQEREELKNNVYLECIHRDGLPKLLLLRMRDDINIELSNLLSDMNFNVYFDENMTLKMYHNSKPEAIIDVISGCGMERSFISVVLRLALRMINNKSIGNILFLDELTGKLVDESVVKFFELLHNMKERIDKIVIVEHAYSDQLKPDYVINVTNDDKGVSEIECNW